MKMFVSGLTRNRSFYTVFVLAVAIAVLVVLAKTGSVDASVGASPIEKTVTPAVASPAAVFPADAPSLGAIPDGPTGCGNYTSAPRDVTFQVSGISGTITDVRVSTTFSPAHTWRGDLSLELLAPGGAPSKTILRQTGSTTAAGCGSSNDAAGPYNFFDTAAPATSWWLSAATPTTAGDYKASTPGGVVGGGADTTITPTFAGLGAAANGTWTLRILDGGGGDTGSISAASLTITGAPAILTKPNADFTGDGKTDFSMVRNVTPGLSGGGEPYRFESVRERMKYMADNPPTESENLAPGTNLQWFVNNSAASGTNTIVGFGEPTTDFIVPSDYDGDGKADIAIWRPGAAGVAQFNILQSSNSVVRVELFGQTGDDPAITGDYDGDGKSDVAVQRCPPVGSPGQCFYFYRGSSANPGGNVTYVPWGFGQQFDFFANPGDFDGDGKFDFCLQRTAPGAAPRGQFVLLKSTGGIEYIDWGLNNDLIVPGDYDGDGKYDFMVSRTETIGGNPGRSYYLLERDGGGTGGSPIRWGIAGDVRTPGDFDGDGKTDVAIWRAAAAPSTSQYYVRRSSDGALQTFGYGNTGDAAVPGWNVH